MQGTKLTQQQQRIWSSMIRTVENYKRGKLSFPELVVALEGAFEAGQFGDGSLVERFYDLWQPLEVTNAIKGIQAASHEVATEIQALEDFLVEYQRVGEVWS